MKPVDPRAAPPLVLLGALLLACAGAPAGRPAAGDGEAPGRFPSPEQLEQLRRSPAPEDPFADDVRDLERWELAGPFPARVEPLPYAGETPWDALLAEEVRHRAGLALATEAMHCFAREIGLFHLANEGQPAESLRRFMAARCHTSVSAIQFGHLHGDVPEAVGDEALLARWGARARELVRKRGVGGPTTAGVWFGRRDGHAVFVAAFGRRELLVEPVATIPGPGGALEIRGEVLTPTGNLAALVSRGPFGVAECASVPGVELPRFHFACETDPRDASAAVTVALVPPGRFLSHGVLDLVVWPGGAPSAVWERPTYAPAWRATDARTAVLRFVEMLNRVRASAGLAPLELEERQSRIAGELAPHFFASFAGPEWDPSADLAALGVLAGWNVDGIVQSGSFAASWVVQTDDVERLLSAALEIPVGRRALLDPEADRIAVGAVFDPARPSLAAIFGTYALFSEEAHDAHVQEVFARLRAERARRGVEAPDLLHELEPLSVRAASQVQGGVEPRDAFDGLVEESHELLRLPVSGWIAEASSLDEIEFPEEFLTRPSLQISIGVSHRRPEGSAWGRYVVMMVTALPERRQL